MVATRVILAKTDARTGKKDIRRDDAAPVIYDDSESTTSQTKRGYRVQRGDAGAYNSSPTPNEKVTARAGMDGAEEMRDAA
jgi:hypothetical protein